MSPVPKRERWRIIVRALGEDAAHGIALREEHRLSPKALEAIVNEAFIHGQLDVALAQGFPDLEEIRARAMRDAREEWAKRIEPWTEKAGEMNFELKGRAERAEARLALFESIARQARSWAFLIADAQWFFHGFRASRPPEAEGIELPDRIRLNDLRSALERAAEIPLTQDEEIPF